jgi:hypothetical protein
LIPASAGMTGKRSKRIFSQLLRGEGEGDSGRKFLQRLGFGF